jgi:hypothetical protein
LLVFVGLLNISLFLNQQAEVSTVDEAAAGCGMPNAIYTTVSFKSRNRRVGEYKGKEPQVMKSGFISILAITTLALTAICATANTASAQGVFKGSFTLDESVVWNNQSLPAGEYSFTLKSTALPAQIALDGPDGGRFILTASTDRKNAGHSSVMTIERRGATRFVSDIYLAELGLRLYYHAPKAENDQLAKGPVTHEQVLIAQAR